MAALSVIVPTCGRLTVARTVAATAAQLSRDDELLVCSDGGDPVVENLCRLWAGRGHRVRYLQESRPGSVFGNAQRDHAIASAVGSHLVFVDDDDVHELGALELIRRAVDAQPRAVHVFRARWGAGHHACGTVLWREPVWREQNLGTPMVIVPRTSSLPAWMDFNDRGVVSDYGWLTAALGMRRLVWHEQVIATVRPTS